MNYEFKEISYPSSDGIHTIHAEIYFPKQRTPVGIVQIAHGMVDYVERYEPLADFLTGEGYIVAGNDHLGHGKSVFSPDELGYFAKKGGTDYVIEDLYEMNKILRNTYKGLPLVLLGHSMGSFIARIYANKYPHSISGLIIHGTAGPNPILPLGKAVAALISLLRGERYRSKMLKKLSTGVYDKRRHSFREVFKPFLRIRFSEKTEKVAVSRSGKGKSAAHVLVFIGNCLRFSRQPRILAFFLREALVVNAC